ncbi:MAG: tetratricopeptide repeat protein [Paludibacteraceae bacterium]|nr:tetratricopeptide repeat protein [Paludibacteraceae bacterium]
MKRTIAWIALWCVFFAASAQINTNRLIDIGRNALYFEDYVVAIQYFNQVIKIKPYLADPYFYRAYAKMNLEDWNSAIEDCNKALEINPFLPKVYYCRGYSYRIIGEIEKSTADLRSALKFEPANISTSSLLIDNLMECKLYDEAAQVCDTILNRYPHYSDSWLMHAQIKLAVEDTLTAIASLDKAIENNKYADLAYAIRGIVRYQQGDNTAALADLDKAIAINAFNSDYFGNRAIVKMNAKDLRGAMKDFNEALTLNNRNANVWFNRGLLRAEVGEENLAVEDFTTCLALDPNNDMAYFQRAQTEIHTGQLKEAVDDYSVIISHYPDFTPAWYGRAYAKRQMRDFAGADRDEYTARQIEEEVRSGKRQPNTGTGKKEVMTAESRGIVENLNRQRPDKYKSELRGQVQYHDVPVKAIENFTIATPDSITEYALRRLSNVRLTDCNRIAQTSFGFCIKSHTPSANELAPIFKQTEELGVEIAKHPDNWAALWHRAILLESLHDYESAYNDLCALIALKPDCGLFYFMRGNNRVQELRYRLSEEDWPVGEADLAERDFAKAYELDPSLVYAVYNIGYLALSSNQAGKAVKRFEQAISLSPELAEAYYNLGLILLTQNEKEAGRNYLSKAGELGIQGAYSIIRRYAY